MAERFAHPLTTTRVDELLAAPRERFKVFGVRRLELFGSVARGDARDDSDVDVVVEFDPQWKTFRNFMALAFLLEEAVGRRVELVTIESLSPFLVPRILREAVEVLSVA